MHIHFVLLKKEYIWNTYISTTTRVVSVLYFNRIPVASRDLNYVTVLSFIFFVNIQRHYILYYTCCVRFELKQLLWIIIYYSISYTVVACFRSINNILRCDFVILSNLFRRWYFTRSEKQYIILIYACIICEWCETKILY